MKNCTVLLKRLDPAMLTQNSTKKIRKSLEEMRDYNIRKNQRYRDEMNSRFNVLIKWVPGTETLIRSKILKKTVDYIKKLENEIKQVKKKSLKKYKELEHQIKELEKESEKKENYIKGLEAKIKELETSQTVMDTDSAQPLMTLEMAVTTTMKIPVSLDEEKLLRSSDEEEFLVSPEEEMELLASGDEEELPELNCIEDLRQWLGL
jgi:hypothetical protein